MKKLKIFALYIECLLVWEVSWWVALCGIMLVVCFGELSQSNNITNIVVSVIAPIFYTVILIYILYRVVNWKYNEIKRILAKIEALRKNTDGTF